MKLIPTPKLLILLIFVWLTRVAGAATPSLLWGSHGEAYDPVGRLPDVSFAGYACGDRPIPLVRRSSRIIFRSSGEINPLDFYHPCFYNFHRSIYIYVVSMCPTHGCHAMT